MFRLLGYLGKLKLVVFPDEAAVIVSDLDALGVLCLAEDSIRELVQPRPSSTDCVEHEVVKVIRR